MGKRTGKRAINIDDNTLKSIVYEFDKSISWSDEELHILFSILADISISNGGLINYDVDIDNETEQKYLVRTIKNGIEKVLKNYASSLITESVAETYLTKTSKSKSPFPFLKASEYHEKININTATVEELIKLQGIGKYLAKKIVEYREAHAFKIADEVLKIKGISTKRFMQFADAIFVGPPTEKPTFLISQLAQFESSPTLENYLKLVKYTGGRFVEAMEEIDLTSTPIDEKDYKRIVIEELQKIADRLRRNRFSFSGTYQVVKASSIIEMFRQNTRAESVAKSICNDVEGVAILEDSAYHHFLQRIFSAATKKIWIAMFLISNALDVRPLLNLLVSAREQGIEVRVILDKNPPGTTYGSAVINSEAFNFLSENNVQVRTHSSFKQKLHLKLVLIDDKYAIIGSHNWTEGSFLRYDEKSVFVQSKQLNKRLSSFFDSLWKKCSSGSA